MYATEKVNNHTQDRAQLSNVKKVLKYSNSN